MVYPMKKRKPKSAAKEGNAEERPGAGCTASGGKRRWKRRRFPHSTGIAPADKPQGAWGDRVPQKSGGESVLEEGGKLKYIVIVVEKAQKKW